MSWTLAATGRTVAGLEHLEHELCDELHKVLSDKRFGLLFSHFQGEVAQRLHTVGQAPPAEPETSAPTADAEAAPPAADSAAASKPTAEVAPAKADKATAKPADQGG